MIVAFPVDPDGIVDGENHVKSYHVLVTLSHVGVISGLSIVYVVGLHHESVPPFPL